MARTDRLAADDRLASPDPGDACVLTILAEGVPDGISAADHEAGSGSSLDSPARLVETP